MLAWLIYEDNYRRDFFRSLLSVATVAYGSDILIGLPAYLVARAAIHRRLSAALAINAFVACAPVILLTVLIALFDKGGYPITWSLFWSLLFLASLGAFGGLVFWLIVTERWPSRSLP